MIAVKFEIDELRREMYYEEQYLAVRKEMNDTRWLLLRNVENLKDGKSEKERLQMALRLNMPLSMMYYMKEELTTMRWQYGKKGAEKYLNDWI